MQCRLRPSVFPSAVRLHLAPLFVLVIASFVTGPAAAQSSGHQHPAVPPQPQPAGSTPASGSTAPSPSNDPTTPSAPASAEHAEHAEHAAHSGASMSMPDGHAMNMSFGPIADAQEGSGTSWQSAATPMHAHHSTFGDWQLMAHYNLVLAYENQSGRRGDEQLNSTNWLMLMANQRSGENDLMFRGMFSLEPWTTTAKGYPALFQSGEAYHGHPLVDRQHPHDLFMELSGRYRRLLSHGTVASFYVAPAGEPALGPPAFMHRLSAMDNPASPISHHWLDSTHISFGVLTAGLARKTWQLEGSYFNGREPDEDRWDFEKPRLDSYSGRFTWNPAPEWSAQISHGYLQSPEELHPGEHLRRTTASLLHVMKLGRERHLATTAAWGRNDSGHEPTDAFLLESSYTTGRMTFFGRAERVEKTGEDLQLLPDDRKIPVKQLTLGATRELVRDRPWQLALGGSVTWSDAPRDLDAIYGRHPVGCWIFLRLRPAAMQR